MKSNLQKTRWARLEDETLIPLNEEYPVQMSNSDATAKPLVFLKEENFGADIIHFGSNKRVALHTHEGDHILLVLKGEGVLTYGVEKHSLNAGEIYLVPGDTPHAIDSKTELTLISVGNKHYEAHTSERLTMLPEIQEHAGFYVVRDDLLFGGTKYRALKNIISNISEKEIACAVHSLGHSQLALALAAQKVNKKVTLFYAEEISDAPVFLETQNQENISSNFLPEIHSQQKLDMYIKKYCESTGAYHMPLGFDTEEFAQEIIKTALSLPLQPKEVWLLSGSGTLARALYRAWPKATFNIVNMGFTKPTIPARVFNVREDTNEEAYEKPPYPSSSYYDSKLWYFAKKHASPGALIWNVAG